MTANSPKRLFMADRVATVARTRRTKRADARLLARRRTHDAFDVSRTHIDQSIDQQSFARARAKKKFYHAVSK
jgi:hypothetical protein